MTSVEPLLTSLGLVRHDTTEHYASATRDRSDVSVLRDTRSGVVYIKDHYVGDETYESADYKSEFNRNDFEGARDLERRLRTMATYIVGRRICDFGCGDGAFLRAAADSADEVAGVELRASTLASLTADGIRAATSLEALQVELDTVFFFHSFEHLVEPVEALQQCRSVLSAGGRVVIEVPHANDFLLRGLEVDDFKAFTLWSQHLILHTRTSLRVMAAAAGFRVRTIVGTQRYSVANHLHWLSAGRPGGHRTWLASMQTPALESAYADAMRSIDMTDTLTAILEVDS